VYFAEEARGIHKWWADPDHPGADDELALFGTEGFRGDREGLALYSPSEGPGYLIACDQLAGHSRYLVFAREDPGAAPKASPRLVKVLEGGADDTDGLEASASALVPPFPRGLLVAMNSSGRNFLVYRWESLGID
jgi:3-phytase